MSNASLDELRKIIDDLDSQIVSLLNERAKTAVEVGRVKTQSNKNIYDPARERDILTKIDELNKGPLPNGSIEDVYAAIMTACREIQLRDPDSLQTP